MYRFIITLRDENACWEEEYFVKLPKKMVEPYAKATIDYFNGTLRPHELEREYLGVNIFPQLTEKQPKWEILNYIQKYVDINDWVKYYNSVSKEKGTLKCLRQMEIRV